MTENEVAKIIVDAAFTVHTRLGPGLLESVYEAIMEYELRKRGLLRGSPAADAGHLRRRTDEDRL